MAVAPTYEFMVDTYRDGDFAASIDNLTAYVLRANWNEGMGNAYEEVASPARMTIQLDNSSGIFNTEPTGADLITNGNFASWTSDNPNSWTVTGESGTNPEVSEVGSAYGHNASGTGACNIYSTSATVNIRQSILTVGETYRVTLTVTYQRKGGVVLYTGSTQVSPPMSETGTYTWYFNATDTALIIQNFYFTDVTIDNVSCYLMPRYGCLLRRGTLVRLRMTSGSTYTMFTGRISKRELAPGQIGSRVTTITAEDAMRTLLGTEFLPSLMQDVTVNTAIQEIFDKAVLSWPYSHAYWMLGVQGASELATGTRIYSPPTTSFETGYTTLDFTGDVADVGGQGTDAQTFIRDMMAAEAGGRFWYDPRSQTFTLHNRNHDLLNTTIAATVTEDMMNTEMCQFVAGDDTINQCTVNYLPRTVGATGSVLWTASNLPIQISPGETYKITARYQDPDFPNARVGGMDFIPPKRNTDFWYTRGESPSSPGSGSKVYQSFQFGANSCEITITNNFLLPVWAQQLQLRGTPITTYDNASVTAYNGTSEYNTERVPETLNIPAISDKDFAQSLADYRVSKFGNPIDRFAVVGFRVDNDSKLTNLITLPIGSRITVTEAYLGHNADYIIVGARHEWQGGGNGTHNVYWNLKPISRESWWRVNTAGYAELGVTTRIAF